VKVPAVIAGRKPEFPQCIQATPHCGAGKSGLHADLRNRKFALALREGLDHSQSPRQRSHKVGIAAVRINLR
jgi:hypothetical protein